MGKPRQISDFPFLIIRVSPAIKFLRAQDSNFSKGVSINKRVEGVTSVKPMTDALRQSCRRARKIIEAFINNSKGLVQVCFEIRAAH